MRIEDLEKLIERADQTVAKDKQLDLELILVELLIRVLVSSRELRRELLEKIFPELTGKKELPENPEPSQN